MNKITISGNVVEKPELKQTSTGISTCNIKVAVSRRMAKEGQQTTDYFAVKVWNKLAENCCKFLDKGRKVIVCGSMNIDTYKDKEGNPKQAVYIMADDVEFVSTPAAAPKADEKPAEPRQMSFVEEKVSAEELPF